MRSVGRAYSSQDKSQGGRLMAKEYISVPYERYEELLIIEARFTTVKKIAEMPTKEEQEDDIRGTKEGE